MAYDPVKAHEYYVNYRKKGLKKGRKKGTKTAKAKTVTLLGQSVVGLNDAGKVEAAVIKDRIKKEMNAALASATTEEEKAQIRAEYSRKAQQEISALKGNSQYAKVYKTRAKSGSAKEGGSSGSSKGASSKGEKSEKATTGGKTGGKAKATPKVSKKTLATLRTQISTLRQLALTASAPQKMRMTTIINNLLRTLKNLA